MEQHKSEEGKFNLQTPDRPKHGNVTIFEKLDSTPHSTSSRSRRPIRTSVHGSEAKDFMSSGWLAMAAKSKSIFRSHLKHIFLFPKRRNFFLCRSVREGVWGAELAASAISDLWRGKRKSKDVGIESYLLDKGFAIRRTSENPEMKYKK